MKKRRKINKTKINKIVPKKIPLVVQAQKRALKIMQKSNIKLLYKLKSILKKMVKF